MNQEQNSCQLAGVLFCLLLSIIFIAIPAEVQARTGATPWTSEVNFQSLVYGSSTTNDVVRALGRPADEILRYEQMYPTIENLYYYDEDKSGAATVFVFESGFLVGMQLKTADNQYVDFSYLLANNGDRQLMNPMLGGYLPYAFNNYYRQYATIPW
ncbi:MAG TPA: hypothetical protein V6C52_06370 [Coleofasciculaceae cyanobacterium]|jgi:hypothetical protein